jgi:3,4-dihydroxy 2-butanone 4-phosphate synthase/GTP cyclohydrolase II
MTTTSPDGPHGVRRLSSARLPTDSGGFVAHAYLDLATGVEHIALTLGEVSRPGTLVRVHSECATGDLFGSLRCDCGAQLKAAQRRMAGAGRGVLVYLRGQEGRGIGLAAKLNAYQLQDCGADTVDANLMLGHPADSRRYDAAAGILIDLRVRRPLLLTNNPAKSAGLFDAGLDVEACVPLEALPTPESKAYLRTKRLRFGHSLTLA